MAGQGENLGESMVTPCHTPMSLLEYLSVFESQGRNSFHVKTRYKWTPSWDGREMLPAEIHAEEIHAEVTSDDCYLLQ
jgi:hypothetical protein